MEVRHKPTGEPHSLMSSSRTHHAPCTQPAEVTRSGLLKLLKTVPDPRGRRGVNTASPRSWLWVSPRSSRGRSRSSRSVNMRPSTHRDAEVPRREWTGGTGGVHDPTGLRAPRCRPPRPSPGAFLWTRTHTVGTRRVIAWAARPYRSEVQDDHATAPGWRPRSRDQGRGRTVGDHREARVAPSRLVLSSHMRAGEDADRRGRPRSEARLRFVDRGGPLHPRLGNGVSCVRWRVGAWSTP